VAPRCDTTDNRRETQRSVVRVFQTIYYHNMEILKLKTAKKRTLTSSISGDSDVRARNLPDREFLPATAFLPLLRLDRIADDIFFLRLFKIDPGS